jgi:hypothetical protein
VTSKAQEQRQGSWNEWVDMLLSFHTTALLNRVLLNTAERTREWVEVLAGAGATGSPARFPVIAEEILSFSHGWNIRARGPLLESLRIGASPRCFLLMRALVLKQRQTCTQHHPHLALTRFPPAATVACSRVARSETQVQVCSVTSSGVLEKG